MDKLDDFLRELSDLSKKYNINLWTDPMQEDIRLAVNGQGKKGEYKGKKYEYQYGINYDFDNEEYDLFEWIPNNVKIFMDADNEN